MHICIDCGNGEKERAKKKERSIAPIFHIVVLFLRSNDKVVNLNKKIVTYRMRENCYQWDAKDKLFSLEDKPFKQGLIFRKILGDNTVETYRITQVDN